MQTWKMYIDFSESRSKPRVTMVTLSSEWHAKLILAKSAEMWDDLKNGVFYIACPKL